MVNLSYLRPFTDAIGVSAQLSHLHKILHTIVDQLTEMESNMATQDDINALADKIDSAVSDLTSELAAAKQANPDVDLSRLDAAVQKLSDLDVANAAPAASAPADDSAPSASADASQSAQPVTTDAAANPGVTDPATVAPTPDVVNTDQSAS